MPEFDVPVSDIGLFEAMYTLRSIRSYKPDPVSDELIGRVIEAATKATNGGNRQPWGFVVVKDPAKRAVIAGYVRQGYARMLAEERQRLGPDAPSMYEGARPMIENFEQIPVLIFVCEAGVTGQPGRSAGSIFPAIQNLLLAARGLGLGGVLTVGFTVANWPEIKELLHMPEDANPLAMIPLGYPDKMRYGPTSRVPWREVTHWEQWGNHHLQEA